MYWAKNETNANKQKAENNEIKINQNAFFQSRIHTHKHIHILTRHYTNTTSLKAFFTAPLLFFSSSVSLFTVSQHIHTNFCLFCCCCCFVAVFIFCEYNVHIKNQICCVTFSPQNEFCAHEQSIGMASGKPNLQIIFKHTVSLSFSNLRYFFAFFMFLLLLSHNFQLFFFVPINTKKWEKEQKSWWVCCVCGSS